MPISNIACVVMSIDLDWIHMVGPALKLKAKNYKTRPVFFAAQRDTKARRPQLRDNLI